MGRNHEAVAGQADLLPLLNEKITYKPAVSQLVRSPA
jgi:hypothetical protein